MRDLPTDWPADKVERRAIETLVPAARNARTHSPEQVEQIAAAMAEWGWTNPVLIDEQGEIIAGHGRIMAAHKLGIASVPVMTARGWTADQKRAYMIADNKLALNAGWDYALLVPELMDVGADLRPLIGFSPDELRGLSIGVPTDQLPDIPEGERGEFQQMTIVVHRSQLETIQAAMRLALSRRPADGPNPNKNGAAFALICEGYLTACPPEPATSSSLQ